MRYLTVILSLICILFTAHTAKADKRVAFVVGNGAYKNVAQLPNPPIDAKAMAGVLRNVGFDVVEGTNLTRDTMTERLLEFGKKAQGADVAVFFYAGHGIAISGTNYLLPVDAVATTQTSSSDDSDSKPSRRRHSGGGGGGGGGGNPGAFIGGVMGGMMGGMFRR